MGKTMYGLMIERGPKSTMKAILHLKEPDQQEHHYVVELCQQLLELLLGVNC